LSQIIQWLVISEIKQITVFDKEGHLMDNLMEFSEQLNTTKKQEFSDIKLSVKGNSIIIDNYKKNEDDKPSKI